MKRIQWGFIAVILLLATVLASPVQAAETSGYGEGTYTAGKDIPSGLQTFSIQQGKAAVYLKRGTATLAGETIDGSGAQSQNKFTASLQEGDTVELALDEGASKVEVNPGTTDLSSLSAGFYEIGKDLAEGTYIVKHPKDAGTSTHISIFDSALQETQSFTVDSDSNKREQVLNHGEYLYISGGSVSILEKDLVPGSIQLNRKSLTLEEGKTAKLTATVFPATATDRKVTWTSSNPAIATVDASGNVKAVKAGTATITVSAKGDSDVQEQLTVTVTKILPNSLKLSKSALDIAIKQSVKVTASVGPANAADKTVTWKSSNSRIATVDAKGNIKGVAKGSVTITATTKANPKISKQIKVTVSPKTVKASKTSLTLIAGKTATLTATVSPKDSTDKAIAWKSSNTKVATVDKKGKVIAKKKGTATITASAKSAKSAKVKVTVKAPIQAKTIKLNKTSAKLKKGQTLTLKATVGPSNTTNKTVKWKSSNTKVATVNSKGVVTAKGAGTAKITAATTNGKTASATITVPYVKTLGAGTWKVGKDIPAGRYRITTNDDLGNLFIDTTDFERYVNEILTNGEDDFGVTVVTTDLKKGDSIEISSLNSVQFERVAHKKSNTLHSGYWTVGKDISPGKYRITTTSDAGNLAVFRGDYLVVNEILGNNTDGFGVSSVTTTLKTGDKISISGLEKVKFTKK